MSTRLLLADDHVLVRNGLRNLLLHEGFEVVAEASNGREAVEQTVEVDPDVALLDISMPLLNGIDAARQINNTSPRTKVILLTMHKEEQYALEGLRSGIKGYVLKTQDTGDLVQAIRTVMHGDTYLSPTISGTVVSAALGKAIPAGVSLTRRERQILQLVAESKTNKDIAQLLDINIKTVDAHRSNLMKKLDLHGIAGLVRYAIKIGLIQP
jgi:DNA-binding NarL/FixJ family response regulator